MAARALAVAFVATSFLVDTVVQGAVLHSKRWQTSIISLPQSQISAFKPFTFFAGAAFCDPSTTLTWTCGADCDANAGFQPTASGGDGDKVQFCGHPFLDILFPKCNIHSVSGYVGWDPAQSTVIVAHQGTDTSQILPVLTDGDILMTPLDTTLFPGISSSISVHNGFGMAQAKAAPDMLAAVQKTISEHNAASVTVVGHSLGAAISLIDSVYLKLHLPSSVTITTILYGLPRVANFFSLPGHIVTDPMSLFKVGNQAFADYIDANLHLTHINNKKDPVPIIPGRFFGYVHPAGEVHIMEDNEWVSCPGQDNSSTECIVGAEPNLFDSDSSDHDGPYDGVEIGC
ncbi:hypothetical protein EW146_g3996 [Bondarzewia mesenterica]|uniref:Fungal lipase-type domain-containing protein n=1 Tax=Bondarzewia mesenterica TaxID=1095465 RepID=A0A4S4LWY2_9AGAM|nr:hypothetical protein EW146_g3996 [Bondarzewia mesenterica]